jgi:Flp pilus assembly protein TadD
MENRRSSKAARPAALALILLGAAAPLCAQLEASLAASAPPVSSDLARQADALLAQGRMREAIPLYRAWLKANPGDATSQNRLGLSLQKTGQGNEARRHYEQATKLDRCYAEAWNNLGTLDHVRGKCKKALGAYRKAVACRPDSALFQRNLGAAYLELGDVSRSAQAFSEALRLDPTVLDPVSGYGVSISGARLARRYFEVARSCAQRGELENALRLLNRAHALGLDDFARTVASDRAFAGLLADPQLADQLR